MGKAIDLRKQSEPMKVEVVNQLDLTTIESLLTSIKDSSIAIDANTDLVEAKLDSVISELQTNGTTNSADLLLVLTELQSIDANTDTLESQLASVISNTTNNATEAKQDIQISNQGSAGVVAPFGSGILGWLRGVYDRLFNITGLTFTGTDLNVKVSDMPPVATSQGPTQFVKDTVDTEVNLDTVDPLNNEPLPVCLYDEKGKKGVKSNPFGISQYDDQTGSRQIVDLNGAAKVGESIILCGGVLYGQTLSPLLWQSLSINGGTTFGNNGEQRLETGTAADGQVILQSKKKSRFMISQFNINHFGVQLNPTDLLDPNTIWEWGSVTFLNDDGTLNATPNGIFLRVTGGATPTWEVVNVKDGVENAVDSSLWNGVNKDLLNKTPTLSVYEMQYNAGTAFFFQGSNFLHRIAGLASTYAATYNFPVALRIRNINGNTNNRGVAARAAGAYRLGEERGELIPRAFTTNTLVKTGAGYIGKAFLSRTGSAGGSGNAFIYDSVDNTGVLIGRIDVGGDDVKGITLDGTFSNGLYIEISGTGTNTLTINFE